MVPRRPPPACDDDGALAPSDMRSLYTREASGLRRFFGRQLRGHDEVADLVQETFLRFLGGSPTGVIERPSAYLQRIARNLLFDRARKRGRQDGTLMAMPIEDVEIGTPPEQSYSIDAAQLMERYHRALDTLPPRTREVFLLHRVDELSYRDIASRLGIGVRTVEWHIAEALVRIRRLLDEA